MKELKDWINGKSKYLLFCIIVLSAGLRIYHINYQSLWLDELYSIVPTAPQNSIASIIEYAKIDQPPFFFIFIHYIFRIFGYNELVGRLTCAAIGLLGIFAVYLLGKEIQGKETGLFAAFLTGLSYFHIYYSQELRFYTMAFLLSTLSYLFFIKAFKNNRLIDFAWYAVITCGLLYTHYYGLIIFCSQGLTFLILLIYKKNSKFVIASITSAVAIIIAFIPWIPIIIMDSSSTSTWIRKPDPFFLAVYLYDYTGKEILTMLLFISFIVLFIRSFRTYFSRSQEQKPVYLIIILWIILSYFLPYLWSVISIPLLHQKYTIVTLPAWMLIFSMGWNEIRDLKLKYASIALLILGFSVNMIFFKQHYTRLEKDQFRESSEWVLTNNTANYPVFSSHAWHFNYYFRNHVQKVWELQDADFSGVENLWLLQAHSTPEEMESEINRLKINYEPVEVHPLFGANAIRMHRK